MAILLTATMLLTISIESTSVGAGAGAVALLAVFSLMVVRTGYRRFAFAGLIVLNIIGLLVFVRLWSVNMITDAPVVLFLIVILPLANAVFDFLSFGVTRMLLWQTTKKPVSVFNAGVAAKLIGIALLDFLIAGGLLILLSWTIITLMHWFNLAALAGPTGAPLFDINAKFDALTNPSDLPQWVYVMHFSTFLPSVAHLCVMALAVPNLFLESRISKNLAKQIDPSLAGNTGGRVKIALWKTLGEGARVVIPVALVCLFVMYPSELGDGVSAFGHFFLDRAIWYATVIGAV